MGNESKMRCPGCGTPMNHHADKIIYGSASSEGVGPFFGSVEELHQCPACGAAASRPEVVAEN